MSGTVIISLIGTLVGMLITVGGVFIAVGGLKEKNKRQCRNKQSARGTY